jgi:uncharacterized protein
VSLYVDTSALLKLYVDEPDSDSCEALLTTDPDWVTARHTLVEARRNLRRLLGPSDDYLDALAQFTDDWTRCRVVELDADLCLSAAQIAERTGARSLDALHLAAAVSSEVATVVTYDRRLAQAARDEGLTVANPGQHG